MLKKHRVLELAVVIAVLLSVTMSASAGDMVKLYGDRDYGGWEAIFSVGEFTTADLLAAGGVDNAVDSVRVASGYKIG